MKKKIIIWTSLNAYNFGTMRLTKEWISYRLKIYMNYTLKSLKNQTNQNFQAYLLYDPQTENIIFDELKKYKELPNNVCLLRKEKEKEFILKSIAGFDKLYLVRIDSDDMYHRTFIDYLQKYTPKEETQVLINQKGYIYDSTKNRLGHYFYRSTPFFAYVYNVDDYAKGLRYKASGHATVIELKHEILNENNFMVLIHSQNNSTHYISPCFMGEICDHHMLKAILEEFKGKD